MKAVSALVWQNDYIHTLERTELGKKDFGCELECFCLGKLRVIIMNVQST
jgi:hypothetical protein